MDRIRRLPRRVSQSTSPEALTATGSDPSITVNVDCGDEGVANVTVSYGTGPTQTVLVGRNPTSQAVGSVRTFSQNYGTAPGFEDSHLTVTTAPTKGTCKTTLTDYESGNVLADRETAGKATFSAVVPSPGG
jgi:hypothetical protein